MQPRRDGLRPGSGIAHRVTASQADADFNAVGDRGPPVRGEDHRLIPPRREVSQGVVLAENLQQSADRGLVLTGQCVLGALGLEQHHRGGHQRQRTEQSEQRVEKARRFSGEQIGRGEDEPADPVDRVGQPVVGLQRTGEHLQQPPGQGDPQQVPGHQHRGGLVQRSTAHLGRELVVGQRQHRDDGDMDCQAQ